MKLNKHTLQDSKTKHQSILENYTFQSKTQEYFSNNGNLVLFERKYLLDQIIMIKSDFIVDMIKETKGVTKIGTKPEECQRVEINKERFTKRNSGDILLSQ